MSPRLRPIAVKMSKNLIEAIDLYAMNNGKHRSEVVREAVIEYLSKRGVRNVPKF
jgi:metal-responsive CopG/Arc/MetJ family transcriptional regulator